MRLEKQRNYSNANSGNSGSSGHSGISRMSGMSGKSGVSGMSGGLRKELCDTLLYQWVYLRLKRLSFLRVGKHLGGNAPPFRRIGNQLVNDVVGINRLDAKLVQIMRQEGLAAGNPSR